MASLKSIRQFSKNFSKEKYNTISVLINNAGLQNIGKTKYTKDKFEVTFGTNHIGPFALTQLLLPNMLNDGLITFTASETHDPALKTPIEPPVFSTVNELAFPEETSEKINIVGQRRYSTSKLCNIMTTYELQKQLGNTNIRVNAYDPGMTPGTGLAKSYPPMVRFLWKNIFPVLTLFKKNVHTPSQAGKNLANLAYAKKHKSLKGICFSDGKVVKTSIDSYNKDFQKELWNGSLKLINMEFIDV